MKRNYNLETTVVEKKMARALSVGVNASLKYATEICNQVRGKPVKKVEAFLERVLEKEEHLPLPRYNKKVAHRKGEAKEHTKSGRYPEKTVKVFLKLVQSAKANADYKGLDAEKLVVLHAFASQAFGRPSYQNKGHISGKRRKTKSCHIEIVLLEAA
ncbi:MAG: 50S ribosomal protein L22 [Candidatus Diapherotrites archaeon]|uniref:50S ribosomal protein L22 n=1 Tax=Candidatus Iainarchaeum sp. TaxID=3101447 RepID=A0A8T4L5G0_9ARCH|nr:50S ribosomal protein L22 [Candidatus Diapherotrites archaeon]